MQVAQSYLKPSPNFSQVPFMQEIPQQCLGGGGAPLSADCFLGSVSFGNGQFVSQTKYSSKGKPVFTGKLHLHPSFSHLKTSARLPRKNR